LKNGLLKGNRNYAVAVPFIGMVAIKITFRRMLINIDMACVGSRIRNPFGSHFRI
jgi:hypothetical protein